MGDYDGTFVSYEFGYFTITDEHGEEQQWPVKANKVGVKIDKLDLRVGDTVRVEVEFNNYTVVGVRMLDLDPRALLARIEALEKQLKDGQQ